VAGRSTIKELIVKIVGDATALVQASGQSEAAIKRIAARAAQVGKALAAAGVAGVGAFGALVARSIETADNARKTAQAIGTTTETLTGLRHAADLSGVSNEELEKGLAKMARASSDAAAGLASQKAAFDSLGVAVTDSEGKLRPQRELLGDMAERFAAMEDGTRKTALAQEVFGRAGTKLIPMLNQGRAGLAAMTDEAARLGLVIDDDTAAAAEQFRDNLTRLKGVFTGAINLVAQRVLPILLDLSNRFVDASGKTGGFQGAIAGAEGVLRGFLSVGAVVKGVLVTLAHELGNVAAVVVLALQGKWRAAFEAVKETGRDFVADVGQVGTDLANVWYSVGKNVESRAPAIGAQLAAPAVEARTKIKDATAKAAEDVAAFVGKLEEERATTGQTAEAVTRYQLAKLGASEATIEHALALQRDIALLKADADATDELAKKAAAITTEFQTATEKYAARQTELNALLEGGKISGETYVRAIVAARGELDKTTTSTETFGAAIASSMEQAATSGKLSFSAFANSVIAQLKRILVQALITRAVAFFLPGLGSIGAAIGGAVSGRQHGGPVQGGRAYLVGERGPELFVPQASGAIVPSGGGLRLDLASLPPYPRVMDPRELALDTWWRQAFGHLVADGRDRGVRFA
jgi:hypothetical protein